MEIQKALGHHLQVRDLKHQLRFKPKDFPDMAQGAGRGRAVWCDEGSGDGANRMQPMKAENVEVGIDLDACRGREQPVFWANPYRHDLTRQVQKHMTWCFEFAADHSMVAWEAEAPDAVFGREPFLHERFRLGAVPWLEEYAPEVRAEYLALKDLHGRGLDVHQAAERETRLLRYRSLVDQILGKR